MAIVRPAWVVDSASAARLLPTRDYSLIPSLSGRALSFAAPSVRLGNAATASASSTAAAVSAASASISEIVASSTGLRSMSSSAGSCASAASFAVTVPSSASSSFRSIAAAPARTLPAPRPIDVSLPRATTLAHVRPPPPSSASAVSDPYAAADAETESESASASALANPLLLHAGAPFRARATTTLPPALPTLMGLPSRSAAADASNTASDAARVADAASTASLPVLAALLSATPPRAQGHAVDSPAALHVNGIVTQSPALKTSTASPPPPPPAPKFSALPDTWRSFVGHANQSSAVSSFSTSSAASTNHDEQDRDEIMEDGHVDDDDSADADSMMEMMDNDEDTPSGSHLHSTSGHQSSSDRPPAQRRSGPRSSLDDPHFVTNFFQQSRLHFIGSWQRILHALPSFAVGTPLHRRPSHVARRLIVHVDMDCFFAAVAQRDRPHLPRDAPIVICHSGVRASVSEWQSVMASTIANHCDYQIIAQNKTQNSGRDDQK